LSSPLISDGRETAASKVCSERIHSDGCGKNSFSGHSEARERQRLAMPSMNRSRIASAVGPASAANAAHGAGGLATNA